MVPNIDSDILESELAQLRDTNLSREQIDEIVRGLGQIIGLEDLELDEHGVAELTVDDSLELSLIHIPTYPGIIAAVAMPERAEENTSVLRKLLQVNMSWSLTQGGSFVFVPPRLALCRLVPLTAGNSKLLDRELATFVALGKAWKAEIITYQSENEGSTDSSTDQSDQDFVGLKV